jgi:hypothetical protein
MPAALALAMPSICRSRRRLVSNSANTPEHFEEGLAGSGAGVDRLFGRLQDGAPCFERPDDVLEVSYGAG